MTTPPIPPGTPDGFTVKVPDVPQTMLAFRVFRLDRSRSRILSLNAPAWGAQRKNLIAIALSVEPPGGWPTDKVLEAECNMGRTHPPPGIPAQECSCGIYATTSIDIVNEYLTPDAPVLGVVELGGRTIPATQGFRAKKARLAAVLLVDPVLTTSHMVLRALADTYHVPALVPHSLVPEEYRDHITPPNQLADEVERFLRGQ